MPKNNSSYSVVEVTVTGDDVVINDVHHADVEFDGIEVRSESPCG